MRGYSGPQSDICLLVSIATSAWVRSSSTQTLTSPASFFTLIPTDARCDQLQWCHFRSSNTCSCPAAQPWTTVVPSLNSFHLVHWTVLEFYLPHVQSPAAPPHPCSLPGPTYSLMEICRSACIRATLSVHASFICTAQETVCVRVHVCTWGLSTTSSRVAGETNKLTYEISSQRLWRIRKSLQTHHCHSGLV